ncbi:MAG: PhzF family phenazine biosynthesis protein [Natronospirillum sp.]|uniref:PhzF family phenazine biosynthesis protein n=1 Tax=Natronospirillum sp. TaxID=2812955 RepID=UPI0025F53158|nr:PhzF family phenazine biosynthesis protein [Natronospirillum sp.]MCH8553261.1 PhzF family phenazine biosynthesis protein [Natronospirillum sp.]
MELNYYTCDVFTKTRFGGNPLAVVPDARGLSTEQMQTLAREFNYSETTFVLPPEDSQHTRQVRIFTPQIEVPFAGHPNVGTAFMLTALGQVPLVNEHATLHFEEKAGLVTVTVARRSKDEVYCELQAPQRLSLGETVSAEELAGAVGLKPGDILTATHQPTVASVGLPFLVAEVTDRAALARANPNINAMQALQGRGITPDIHLYTRDGDGYDLRTRMFAPLDGVLEDPATGSANCALSGLLAHCQPEADGDWQWHIAQGVEMGRPSELFARVDKQAGQVGTVRMGGYSVRVASGTIRAD